MHWTKPDQATPPPLTPTQEILEGGSPSTASQRQRDSRRRNWMRRGEAGEQLESSGRNTAKHSKKCKVKVARWVIPQWCIGDPRDTWNPQTCSMLGISKTGDTVKMRIKEIKRREEKEWYCLTLKLTLTRQVTENSVTLVQENQQPHVFAFDHVGALWTLVTPVRLWMVTICKVCFRCVRVFVTGFEAEVFGVDSTQPQVFDMPWTWPEQSSRKSIEISL